MTVVCMHCGTVTGTRGEEEGETAEMCDGCLEKHHASTLTPRQIATVKVHRTCGTCQNRTIKCNLVPCDELNKRLVAVDQDLKRKGL